MRPRAQLVAAVGPDEREQLLAVPGVVEAVVRRADVDPGDLVDLVLERAGAAGHAGRPVVHLLGGRTSGRVEHGVLRRRQRHPEAHDEPGLLEGLAGRGHAGVLAGVELALGPRPVVVLRPVHEGDLQASVATAPGQRAGGGDH